ncbi:uncharacterized protein LOC122856417 [Aphidius gifuensis]|uniref:uncharacterized protein LOC122856417 n=1 Tax=Aphidius gifuensis TaxID=684658 RepID=UPI001CDB69ED|nr:uncharacterized protein LOC122856417 [Aphidius gifuensis]
MGQKIINNSFGFPPPRALPGTNIVLPHVILADEAFKLSVNIMKPYTRKSSVTNGAESVFNYRLSRARRVTENAFGLISQVFRIFYQPINLEVSTCDLVWVCCCLHNMLRDTYLESNISSHKYSNKDNSQPKNNMISLTGHGNLS